MSSNQPPQGPYTPQHGPYGQPPTQPPTQPAYGQPAYGQPPPGAYGQQPPGQYGPPQGPPGWQSPEYLSGGPGPRRNRRGLVVGGAVVASILVLGGVTFGAYTVLDGGGTQPASALPSTSVGYARIDLDPSAGQKVDLLNLLRQFPEFEEATGISSDTADLRELVLEKVLPELGCDLTYEKDFEPWLGDRAGLAAVPVDETVTPVFAIQVTDEQAAGDAIDALQKCADEGGAAMDFDDMEPSSAGAASLASGVATDTEEPAEDEAGYEFIDDYMVLTEKQHLAAVMADTEESSLAESDTFSSDMDALGEQGIFSYWYDIDAIRELPGVQDTVEASGMGGFLDGFHASYGALRAGDDYIEMFTSARIDEELSDDRTPVDELPENTMVAASFSGGGDLVETYWDDLEAFSDAEESDDIENFEVDTGLTLPDDLVTVLGDSLTFSLSPDGLTPEAVGSEDPAAFDGAARFVTDADALDSIITKLEEFAASEGGTFDLVTSETDDGLVVATNQDYADEVAEGGSLGDSDNFQTAVPNADDSVGVFYVDFDKAHEVLQEFDDGQDEEIAEGLRYLEPMEAAGFSVIQNDGSIDTVFRLTFD